MADQKGFSPYQKSVLLLITLIQFTIVLDFMIIAPIGDFLMKSLEINTRQFGLVVSSYAFSAATAGILAATFVDKYDRKPLLIMFYTGFIVGTLACAMADSYVTLLLARIVTGVFAGITSALLLTIVADVYHINQRGRAMGAVQMAFAISQILGIPAGIYVANHLGWNNSFTLIVLLAALILVGVSVLMKPIRDHLSSNTERRPWVHLWRTVRNSDYQVGFMAVGFLTIGGFLLMPFSAVFLVNNVHLSYDQLPLVFLSSGISTLVVMPIVGSLSDRFDRYRIFAGGSLAAVVMVFIYTHMSETPLWLVMVINVLVFAAIMCRMNPAMAINSMVPQPQDRGAYMSICSSLQQIAGGIASIVAGLVVFQPTQTGPIQHYDILGYLAIAVFTLSLFLVYRVSRRLQAAVTVS